MSITENFWLDDRLDYKLKELDLRITLMNSSDDRLNYEKMELVLSKL